MDAAVVGIPVSSPQPTQLTFEDGLGERRYAIGAVSEPLEVLKLSSVLSSVSSFDFALRERAARLTGFRHDSYGRVRSIEQDRRTSALLVTSDYVAGIRLSTLLAETQKRGLALEFNAVRCLVRQLVLASAALHSAAPDVGNGAIALERLILTPAGRLIVVEYVLGAALEQLGHTRARYWRELAVALPGAAGSPTVFDARTDVTQVGAVTLALILGRPLTPEDYPERLADLIEGATMRSVAGIVEPLPSSTKDWLTQALQLDQWESFASPTDAREMLDQAFGIENPVVELGALQVFLGRYAAADVLPEPDLGPRLEAMKAFLARYPSRRSSAKSEPEMAEETNQPLPPVEPATVVVSHDVSPAPALEPAPESMKIEPPSVTMREAIPQGEPAADREPIAEREPIVAREPLVEREPLAQREPVAQREPITERESILAREPVRETEPAPDDLRLPELTSAIPSYAQERRSATPVLTSRRMQIVAAAAGLVMLVAVIGAFFYFRGAGTAATGTISVTTLPPGISVFIDDKPHGVTPLGVELPPGEHVVELRTDTERRRIPITLTAGGQVSQYLEFARAPQASGELLVRTDPIGALVTVDGTVVGRSPVSVPDLSPGTHTVVMQLNGETQTERVIIENGRTASLVVSLGAAQRPGAAGWVRLDVPTNVQVLENGRVIGSSDFERIMLPVGRHDLEFVNETLGYRERRAVQIAAGQTSTMRLDLPRGSMALNAIPWAEAFVDGTRIGETPIGSYTVPIGTHEVLFRHPELGERRLSVTVTTREQLKVGVDLRSK